MVDHVAANSRRFDFSFTDVGRRCGREIRLPPFNKHIIQLYASLP